MKRTLGEPLRALRALASGYPLHHLRGCGLRPCHSVVPLLSLSLLRASPAMKNKIFVVATGDAINRVSTDFFIKFKK
jgi:hypothetical protein